MKRIAVALIVAAVPLSLTCGNSDRQGLATPAPSPAVPATATTLAPISTPFAPTTSTEPPARAPATAAVSATPVQQAALATTAPAPSPAPGGAPPGPVRLEITASNVQFDKAEVRAKAGAEVTAVLRNNDAGVEHNLTFSVPNLPHGETCAGPCITTQAFTAPAAGRYNFFCNIHSTMLGDFVVE